MKHSDDRILTTHVGSLARPKALIDLIQVKESGEPYDQAEFAKQASSAVADRYASASSAGSTAQP